MNKRRITLNLDEDIVEALQAMGERSVSAAANAALREAVEMEGHHRALAEWLDELNALYGAPTPEELARADTLLDELEGRPHSEAAA